MPANTSPIFLLTPKVGAGSISTANTNRDGTGTIATIFSAGSNGSKINFITIKATADPADCTVVFYVVLDSGPTYYVWDEWDIGNPAAGSATVPSYQETRHYSNLILPTGYSLRSSITVALTAGVVNVLAFGGDY